MSKKVISYIFPIYNEEDSIEALFKAINPQIKRIDNRYDIQIICVNDGSKDNSLEKLMELQAKDKRIVIMNQARNFGHQMAITAGLDYAAGDAVIIMDADLQDPPSVSIELVKKWEEGYEVVYAQRRTRKDGVFKRFSAYMFYRVLNKLADIRIPKDTGDFRLMDRKVVDTIKQFRERNRFMRGMVAYVGFRQTAVLFDRDERFAGVTNYPLRKMIKLAMDGVTSFSTVPLQMITRLGFWVSGLSFLGIIYAIVLKVFYPEITVSGWTLLIVSILFIGGVQMIMLGILGTYVGRIYAEVQGRPLYIISSIIDHGSSSKNS